jgi:hypothetical protein
MTAGTVGKSVLLWRGDRQAQAKPRRATSVQSCVRCAGCARHSRGTCGLRRQVCGRGARATSEARWRARLGRSDFRRENRLALDAMLRDVASSGGWVSARKRGSSSHEASGLGHGHLYLSHHPTYVLCEINVSSVAPFPEQAPEEIARLAMARLLSSKKMRITRNA